MPKTFNEMISEQVEKETLLEAFLDMTISNTPIVQESTINESSLILECDENGVFPDDVEDDEIDRKLGV